VLLSVLALALGTSTVALADPEGVQPAGVTAPDLLALITDDDVFSTADLSLLLATPATPVAPAGTPTQHYGPYTTESPDSGTCGNDWATDTFDRHFTVKTNNDGTFTVVEQFKNGTFVTPAPPDDLAATDVSPGSCEPGGTPGTVDSGITGPMHGYFIIPLPAGTFQTSTSQNCDGATPTNADCDTATFINTHFTACYPVDCGVTTFFFHYSAGDQQLVEHEWKNASDDRGGNHGDIRSHNL
jgi:hypothetical protein